MLRIYTFMDHCTGAGTVVDAEDAISALKEIHRGYGNSSASGLELIRVIGIGVDDDDLLAERQAIELHVSAVVHH